MFVEKNINFLRVKLRLYVIAQIIFKASRFRKLCLTRRELSGREMSEGEVSGGKCPGRQIFWVGNARGELSGRELSVGGSCPVGTFPGGIVLGGIYL